MKPNRIECLAMFDVTNDAFGLLSLRQHQSELAFTFTLLTSECGPFWKSTKVMFFIQIFNLCKIL